jgi:O-antigen ligase
LGTFGNPNFISSFLGMTCAALMSMVMKTQLSWRIRSIYALCAILAFYEITKTASVQGYVVAAAGVTFVIFLKLRSWSNQMYSYFFVGVASLLGLLAVLGTFQVGPLTRFIYQGTLAFRGQYWRAGINMGNSDPLTGVGADSYGNYYRMFRDPQALITPGVKTVTNSAHNVILDLFSSGGYVVALSYLALIIYGLSSVIKVIRRQRKFDEVFAITAIFTVDDAIIPTLSLASNLNT